MFAIVLAACSGPPGPSDVVTPLDANHEATIQITVEDSQTYVTQLAHAPDRLLVEIIPGAAADAASLARDVGAAVQSFDDKTRVAVLRVAANDLPSVATQLAARPEVESVEYDYRLPLAAEPRDPEYAQQWHLRKIDAPRAWNLTTGDPNLILAIVDTGVDAGHADLRERQITGFNFVTNNTDADDCCGHGTMVAGVAAAIGDNGTGVCGAAWRGKILPVRVAKPDGDQISALSSDIARGIVWAVDHDAAIVNISFGGTLASQTIARACQYAAASGRIVVAAMGNTGLRDAAADSPWMIHVSATDSKDALAAFSTFGPAVDLAAPGVNLYTTARGGGYDFASGTSFASPLTAGVVALMWSVRPEATARQIADLLLSSAADKGSAGVDEMFGHGRLDAGAAVIAAREATLPTDTSPPSVRFASPSDGAALSNKTRVEIDAQDDSGVRSVVLLVDGVEQARDTTAPYAFLLDPVAGQHGAHELRATAVDVAGNVSEAPAIQVVFDAASAAAPPLVTITGLETGANLTGRVAIAARAAAPAGLASVALLLDGKTLAGSSLSASAVTVEFNWNASAAASGRHVLAVKVDGVGGQSAVDQREIVTGR